MTILIYILNAFVFTLASWTIGLLLNNAIKSMPFYSLISNFNFIKKESTNRAIGLTGFKWLVKHTFFKYFNQKLKFKTRPSTSELQDIRTEMVYAEIGHFVTFIAILVVSVIKLINGLATYAVILFIFNIIFNLYPSLLQQQNKTRIDRILKR
ncbi:hypothetical protein ES692_08825 [Psychroserpens burtonensis]|uniref:Glycosyl-4,4'-diaponeurosporenoate acyltransferase n=1 Tax=Psychroserpens burtonensis TaxID=49278 RepID=A0A5C7BG92_9FLAO|nr:hypothetical protein [Psychroserpens burtonensis]TXE17658.1 hypothetical protein ES692_08825 [Psychroserpens burtonensis]